MFSQHPIVLFFKIGIMHQEKYRKERYGHFYVELICDNCSRCKCILLNTTSHDVSIPRQLLVYLLPDVWKVIIMGCISDILIFIWDLQIRFKKKVRMRTRCDLNMKREIWPIDNMQPGHKLKGFSVSANTLIFIVQIYTVRRVHTCMHIQQNMTSSITVKREEKVSD